MELAGDVPGTFFRNSKMMETTVKQTEVALAASVERACLDGRSLPMPGLSSMPGQINEGHRSFGREGL